jgi:hypothetical protein
MLSHFLLTGGGRTATPTALDLEALRRRLAGEEPPKVVIRHGGRFFAVRYRPSPPPVPPQ